MTNTDYDNLMLKKPKESDDYVECSDFVVNAVEGIIKKAMGEERNKIIINTNLRLGIPMENVNKIAGPYNYPQNLDSTIWCMLDAPNRKKGGRY